MRENVLLVKYGEIHLKGLNRPFFKNLLKERLLENLKGLGCFVYEQDSRIFVTEYAPEVERPAINRIRRTFGTVGVCTAAKVEKDMDVIKEAAKEKLLEALEKSPEKKRTFKVEARRQDKTFSPDSLGICRQVGEYLLDSVGGVTVDVRAPEHTVQIEIRDKAYVYSHQEQCAGGMPVGSSGKGMLLISGGIDSPVAGYMMAKRGLVIEAVHFLSPPYTGEAAKQKVVDLIAKLSGYCGPVNLHIVRFTEIQENIYEKCNHEFLTVIMRRFMMRIAQELAGKANCGALITGESLGQVASQTLHSITATQEVADRPVFRPLIGMDKNEIIDRAKSIGTYDISILPGEDCCTVFVPKHPKTHPKLENILGQEKLLDVEGLTKAAVDGAITERIYAQAD